MVTVDKETRVSRLYYQDSPYHTKKVPSTGGILTLTFLPERDKQN
jgi:hypothetical protein